MIKSKAISRIILAGLLLNLLSPSPARALEPTAVARAIEPSMVRILVEDLAVLQAEGLDRPPVRLSEAASERLEPGL